MRGPDGEAGGRAGGFQRQLVPGLSAAVQRLNPADALSDFELGRDAVDHAGPVPHWLPTEVRVSFQTMLRFSADPTAANNHCFEDSSGWPSRLVNTSTA
jgi:hypothetical protein